MRRTLAITIFLVASSFVVWGQTSIEYSTLSSGTAAGITKSGNSGANALGEVGRRLDNAMGTSSKSSSAQPSNSSSRPVANSPDTLMRFNRQQLDKQAQQQGCSNLHISSVPKDATLFIDHLAVAATPADLCVPVGKHMLELRSAGFKPWSQEVTVVAGATLSLAPKLAEQKQTKDYQRTVNVTF